jgi:hypothetical protein
MTPLRGKRAHAWILGGLVLFFAAVYLAWYPRTFSIQDEQAYLSYALVLSQGTLYPDVAGVHMTRAMPAGDHVVPRFGLGTSLLFAAVVNFDWRLSFALILLIHLAGTLACAATLRKVDLPTWYACLYLFHPVAALYSRTAMSDIPTMTLTMLGLWAYLAPRSRPLLAGLCWGLMPHFRFAQSVVVAMLGLATFLRDVAKMRETRRLDLRRTFLVGCGMLPGLVLFGAVNTIFYGGPLDTPIYWPLSVEYLPRNLSQYLVSQNLIYPLALLIGVTFPSRLRLECALVYAAVLALYGTFRGAYEGSGLVAMVIEDRYFVAVLPLLLVPYAGALEWVLQRSGRARPVLASLGVAALAVSWVAISVMHDRRLEQQEHVQREIYAATSEDSVIVLNFLAEEYLFEPLGARRVRKWSNVWAEDGPEIASVRRLVSAAAPEAYVLIVLRTDRRHDPGWGADSLLRFAREHYVLDEAASIDRPPDRVLLLRVTGERTPAQ